MSTRLSKEEVDMINPLVDDLKDYINEEPEKARRITKLLYCIINLVCGMDNMSVLESEGLFSVGAKFIYETFRNKPLSSKAVRNIDPTSYIS